MKVKGEIEGTWSGGKTVSEVTLDYEKLFTNHCKRLRTALHGKKRETDLLVNKIFWVIAKQLESLDKVHDILCNSG